MQVTVTIPDAFAAQVEARGLTPEAYLERLVAEEATRLNAAVRPALDPAEFSASLDALARYSDKIPELPIEAFSRESFYEG
jgi:hypothetical protein